MYSTNRHVLFEYWHGISLPTEFAIPKAAIIAITKSGRELDKLGYSNNSVTFWFKDGSWLRTQKYNDKWPDVSKILNLPSKAEPVPETLFKGVNSLAPFTEDNSSISFNDGQLSTNKGLATYDIEGLQKGPSFNAKYLQLIEPIATQIDLNVSNQYLYFFGENIRGAIMKML